MKNQLRQDLVSGDWIVIAPGRAKRPHQLVKKPERRKRSPKKSCPFENLKKSGHKPPILIYGNHDWELQVIENKYPVFAHKDACASLSREGPYSVSDTIGHHDLVITKDHKKNFASLSLKGAQQVFEAFRDRYLMLLNDGCVSYISIFHNWGAKAGASIYHPHYQIMAIPVVPPDISHSLEGSKKYYDKNRRCVHCTMIKQELKNKKRIIYENAGAVAFAPFVSKEPFEFRVFPKRHLSFFENTLDAELDFIAEALQKSLQKLEKNLRDPDYNFFIHTAPVKNKEHYKHYHWHVEIIPKITIDAGFELGTGVEINVVDPDDAAALLRK